MKYARHKAREYALQTLYQMEILRSANEEAINETLDELYAEDVAELLAKEPPPPLPPEPIAPISPKRRKKKAVPRPEDPHEISELKRFTKALVQGTLEHQARIDRLLIRHMNTWKLSRLSVVIRNLLRVSVYEMCFSAETPYQVVIDEAVEIAKDFSDEINRSFVNRVLQTVHDAVKEKLPLLLTQADEQEEGTFDEEDQADDEE